MILDPLKKLDAAVQRAIDASAHAAMRTFGVSKWFVGYAVDTAFLLKIVVQMALDPSVPMLVLALLLLSMNEFMRVQRRRREEAGLPEPGRTTFDQIFKIWLTYELGVRCYSRDWWGLAGEALIMTSVYLRTTPRNPPPKEKRDHARQLAGAEA